MSYSFTKRSKCFLVQLALHLQRSDSWLVYRIGLHTVWPAIESPPGPQFGKVPSAYMLYQGYRKYVNQNVNDWVFEGPIWRLGSENVRYS